MDVRAKTIVRQRECYGLFLLVCFGIAVLWLDSGNRQVTTATNAFTEAAVISSQRLLRQSKAEGPRIAAPLPFGGRDGEFGSEWHDARQLFEFWRSVATPYLDRPAAFHTRRDRDSGSEWVALFTCSRNSSQGANCGWEITNPTAIKSEKQMGSVELRCRLMSIFFEVALQHLIDDASKMGGEFPRFPFKFFLGVADGFYRHQFTRFHTLDDIQSALRYPLLTFSQAVDEPLGMMVPDPHMACGLLEVQGDVRIHGVWNCKNFHDIYSEVEARERPWHEKKDMMVYRGQCLPTIENSPHSRRNSHKTYRIDFCRRWGKSQDELIDLKFTGVKPGCGQNETELPECMGGRINSSDMKEYRYQLSIDGHGASYDGTYWKMRSSGTLFSQVDPQTGRTPYQLFFYPLMQQYVHYVPSTAETLGSRLQQCRQNPKLCMQIGEAGKELALRMLRNKTALKYTGLVLQYVSRLQHVLPHDDLALDGSRHMFLPTLQKSNRLSGSEWQDARTLLDYWKVAAPPPLARPTAFRRLKASAPIMFRGSFITCNKGDSPRSDVICSWEMMDSDSLKNETCLHEDEYRSKLMCVFFEVSLKNLVQSLLEAGRHDEVPHFPFHFYLSLADQFSRTQFGPFSSLEELENALHYPVLTFSKAIEEPLGMPVPDPRMTCGVLFARGEARLKDLLDCASVGEIYSEAEGSENAWRQKQDRMVYRGECVASIVGSPSREDASSSTFRHSRLEFYKNWGDHQDQFIDYKFTVNKTSCEQGDKKGPDGCMGEQVTYQELKDNRYQLSVDGVGAPYDELFWKLKSASTLFSQVDPDTERPSSHLFFYPLMQQYVHYVPCTVHTLGQRLHQCRANERLCEAIGDAGRQLALGMLRNDTALKYTGLLLQYVSELQHASEP